MERGGKKEFYLGNWGEKKGWRSLLVTFLSPILPTEKREVMRKKFGRLCPTEGKEGDGRERSCKFRYFQKKDSLLLSHLGGDER